MYLTIKKNHIMYVFTINFIPKEILFTLKIFPNNFKNIKSLNISNIILKNCLLTLVDHHK